MRITSRRKTRSMAERVGWRQRPAHEEVNSAADAAKRKKKPVDGMPRSQPWENLFASCHCSAIWADAARGDGCSSKRHAKFA
ncbi:hypothetical protein AVEN_152418-1 [Araneus ventricosus]|uniref:Uncharacterized protein n=1 Tax=Araneus ventricosus TaxID=182803 RepID=A0A4Y2G7N8_ARAVE|nr:hypothetical protein AVEN_152418-1 [Araneus ventricosus]